VVEFRKFQKIRPLGALETEGILEGTDPIYIFEKLDGSNTQIRMTEEGLACGKRTDWVIETDGQFKNFYDWVMSHAPFQSLDTDLILFGEWLVRHTVKYQDIYYHKFYLFDVFSISKNAYLPYEDVKAIAEQYGCECLEPMYIGPFVDYDHLQGFVGQSEYAINRGEGIVIKRYGFRNRFDQQAWAKIVCDEFLETFHNKAKGERAVDKYDGSDICRALITKARVQKIREKGRNGELPVEFCGDMRDMRWIPDLIYEDILDEDLRYIATHFQRVDFARLKSRTKGFVAPYLKEIIAEQAV